ncbi:MAG: helix-turn-helix domain-containing protein [Trueperaceae bacterium]|nr:helix-turn-helix domain-containing protein [Trueperaceae bacterium]
MDDSIDTNLKTSTQELKPVFIHSAIDDLGLSLGAFRVYGHLARRAGSSNSAWPSYSSIGEHCFRSSYPKAQEATLRRKALAAVAELKKFGLIEVQERKLGTTKANKSNIYALVPLNTWLQKRDEIRKAKQRKNEELPF